MKVGLNMSSKQGGSRASDEDSKKTSSKPSRMPAKPLPMQPAFETGAAADSADQPEGMKLLNSKIVANKTERVDISKPTDALSEHAGQPIDNKGPDAGLYHSTLEINGFPQKARWFVPADFDESPILGLPGGFSFLRHRQDASHMQATLPSLPLSSYSGTGTRSCRLCRRDRASAAAVRRRHISQPCRLF